LSVSFLLQELWDCECQHHAKETKKGKDVQLTDFGTFSVPDKTIKSVLRKKVVKKK
jgi:nucleoid DNA-binding protein